MYSRKTSRYYTSYDMLIGIYDLFYVANVNKSGILLPKGMGLPWASDKWDANSKQWIIKWLITVGRKLGQQHLNDLSCALETSLRRTTNHECVTNREQCRL